MLPIINCDNCGACCLEQESPPGYVAIISYGIEYAFSETDATRFESLPPVLIEELKKYWEDFIMTKDAPHPNGGACIWFDKSTRKCKHYELRPDMCREILQPGDDDCRGWRKDFGI